jgi:hypothetical protein
LGHLDTPARQECDVVSPSKREGSGRRLGRIPRACGRLPRKRRLGGASARTPLLFWADGAARARGRPNASVAMRGPWRRAIPRQQEETPASGKSHLSSHPSFPIANQTSKLPLPNSRPFSHQNAAGEPRYVATRHRRGDCAYQQRGKRFMRLHAQEPVRHFRERAPDFVAHKIDLL